eukprot:scaffold139335_cov17-Tisochrysis_lutea.AAC.1
MSQRQVAPVVSAARIPCYLFLKTSGGLQAGHEKGVISWLATAGGCEPLRSSTSIVDGDDVIMEIICSKAAFEGMQWCSQETYLNTCDGAR